MIVHGDNEGIMKPWLIYGFMDLWLHHCTVVSLRLIECGKNPPRDANWQIAGPSPSLLLVVDPFI
jgi:hypothetical protein